VELLSEVAGTPIPVDLYGSWLPEEWNFEIGIGFTPADVNAAWKVIKASDHFWLDLGPLSPDLNLEALCRMEDVYFITTRVGRFVKQQTEQWLKDIYNIPSPTVIISSDKGSIARGLDLDLFIDDRDQNLWAVKGSRPECACYVLDYPYNRTVEPAIATRIKSLSEVICEGHVVCEGC
jgi:hypothetical protein